MKKFIIVAACALSLSACTASQQGAAIGAGVGGAVGAVTTGGSLVGTVVGAGAGAIAGGLIGKLASDPTRCVYEDRNGRRYVDVCPRG